MADDATPDMSMFRQGNDHTPIADSLATDLDEITGEIAVGVKVPEPRTPAPASSWGTANTGFLGSTIAVWGMPGSGKTTFLEAIGDAVDAGHTLDGKWRAYPNVDPMARTTPNSSLDFPAATFQGNRQSWILSGDMPEPARWWHRVLRLPGPEVRQITVKLETLDRPGGDFADLGPVDDNDLLRLLQAHGFVYLFDPQQERHNLRVNKEYFDALRAKLLQYYDARPKQHVAVCVAKFDDDATFQKAIEFGWVNQDPVKPRQPRILDEHAREYFIWLCDQFGTRPLFEAIEATFDPRRIRYYASSAIGFRIGGNGEFDPDQPLNYDPTNATAGTLGRRTPINVIEPLVRLYLDIAEGPE
nr:hypothetical protein GCM10020063_084850 [Dactylosporangium thailandense]